MISLSFDKMASLVEKITHDLDGADYGELTTTERHIADLLINAGLMWVDEYDDVRLVQS